MTAEQLTLFRARLASAMTEQDVKETERERKRRNVPNVYRLGHLLRAVEQTCEDIAEEGITAELAFADNFTPSRENHAVARKLGLALDVQRGHWVAVDVQAQEPCIECRLPRRMRIESGPFVCGNRQCGQFKS